MSGRRERFGLRAPTPFWAPRYEKCFDSETGAYFYYNRRTGESLWTKPSLLRGSDVEMPEYEKAKISAGVRYTDLGDAIADGAGPGGRANFEGNSAWSVGFQITYALN